MSAYYSYYTTTPMKFPARRTPLTDRRTVEVAVCAAARDRKGKTCAPQLQVVLCSAICTALSSPLRLGAIGSRSHPSPCDDASCSCGRVLHCGLPWRGHSCHHLLPNLSCPPFLACSPFLPPYSHRRSRFWTVQGFRVMVKQLLFCTAFVLYQPHNACKGL